MENYEEILTKLIRNESYIYNLYDIREEMVIKNNIKLFCYTKDNNHSVVITKQIINIESDRDLLARLVKLSKLIEDNVILVENLWIEEYEDSKDFCNKGFSLYISEFSKETYRKEFGLVNFCYYVQKTNGRDFAKTTTLVCNLLVKLDAIHSYYKIGHKNLSMSNIYFNNNDDVFLGPIKLNDYEENQLWYSSIESDYLGDHLVYDPSYFDIWSLGCIMAEMFFLASPLFYANNSHDKLKKIIEVL
jgi:hypothetical protein